MAGIQRFGALQGAALAAAVRSQPDAELSWWRYLRWRNTAGHILVEVGRPQLPSYLLSQADLALYQAALEASQQLNALPAAERAAGWARLPLEPAVRERLRLEADALWLRSWRGDNDKHHAAPVRFPLRPA